MDRGNQIAKLRTENEELKKLIDRQVWLLDEKRVAKNVLLTYKQNLLDWADEDTEIRNLCKRVLERHVVDGDSHYVPSVVDLVDKLVKIIEGNRRQSKVI